MEIYFFKGIIRPTVKHRPWRKSIFDDAIHGIQQIQNKLREKMVYHYKAQNEKGSGLGLMMSKELKEKSGGL